MWDSGSPAPSGQEHEQWLPFPGDESQGGTWQGKGAVCQAMEEAYRSPVTVSGLEPFCGDKAGLGTQHEVLAILTAPAEQLCIGTFPCYPSTHGEALNPPQSPTKGAALGNRSIPSTTAQSQAPTQAAQSLFIPPMLSLSLSQMVMSGLHWELNEVDCPLVSAISGN